jgi:hypothetical protein
VQFTLSEAEQSREIIAFMYLLDPSADYLVHYPPALSAMSEESLQRCSYDTRIMIVSPGPCRQFVSRADPAPQVLEGVHRH